MVVVAATDAASSVVLVVDGVGVTGAGAVVKGTAPPLMPLASFFASTSESDFNTLLNSYLLPLLPPDDSSARSAKIADMARLILLGTLASLAIASAGATCPTVPTNAVDLTITDAELVTIESKDFFRDSGTNPLVSCGANERVEITSVTVIETAPANIVVNVKYQSLTATNPFTLLSLKDASCYAPSTSDLSFATNAPTNPEKVDAVVEITCPAGTTAGCAVKYEIHASCVTSSGTCPAITATGSTAAASVPNTGAIGKKTLILTDFKTSAGEAITATTCDSTNQRVDITSVKVAEKSGANIKVDVGYTATDATPALVVDSLASGTCYRPASAVTSLSAAEANANAANTIPYVAITCLEPNAAGCSVDYLVQAKCSDKSTCLALLTTATPLPKATPKVIDLTTEVMDSDDKPSAGCGAQRLDITALKIVEVNNAPITATVKYQKDGTTFLVAKSFTGASCYSGSKDDVSFETNAPMNPDLVTPVITISCATTTNDACSIKYKAVGKCVDKSAAVAVPETALAPTTRAWNFSIK